MDAYFDIETTGLSYHYDSLTVVGLYLHSEHTEKLVQLVGEEATEEAVLNTLEGATKIYTYNGSRFDLPFLQAYWGVDLTKVCRHHDLMYDCWKKNLYGGLKAVERHLGIERRLQNMGGVEAIRLWWKYRRDGDQEALETLLAYNGEDLTNLKQLKEALATYNPRRPTPR